MNFNSLDDFLVFRIGFPSTGPSRRLEPLGAEGQRGNVANENYLMVLVHARQRKRQSMGGFTQEDIPAGSKPNPGNRELPLGTWPGNESWSRLLRVAHLFSSFVVNAELLRHRLQRGIELHEGMFDSGMGVMAGITAVALGHGLGGLAARVKAVVGPL